jgi:ornithine cyclodeaminase
LFYNRTYVRTRIVTADDVRAAITPAVALDAVRDAFVRFAHGEAVLPRAFELHLADREGEFHVKGAYLRGQPYFGVKTASGFYRNGAHGLPVNGGMTMIHAAETGVLEFLVFDGGLMTDLRTAAAGALAADLLAVPEVDVVAILGAGIQARFQLDALLGVRRPREVRVWARRDVQAEEYAREMHALHGLQLTVAGSAEAAVEGAGIVVTTTPATEPILDAGAIAPGTHITAMGSDMPHKRELSAALLQRADKLVVDSLDSCRRVGELHHALADGTLSEDAIYAELGAVAAGDRPGRESDAEITVADLTGLGIQDAAVANVLAARVVDGGLGRYIDL